MWINVYYKNHWGWHCRSFQRWPEAGELIETCQSSKNQLETKVHCSAVNCEEQIREEEKFQEWVTEQEAKEAFNPNFSSFDSNYVADMSSPREDD